jgi:hypothetical protein
LVGGGGGTIEMDSIGVEPRSVGCEVTSAVVINGSLYITINASILYQLSITGSPVLTEGQIGQIYKFVRNNNNEWEVKHINGISRGIFNCKLSNQSINYLNNQLYIGGSSWRSNSTANNPISSIGYIDLLTNSYIDLETIAEYNTPRTSNILRVSSSVHYDSINNNIYYTTSTPNTTQNITLQQLNISTLQRLSISGRETARNTKQLIISTTKRKLYLSGNSAIYRYNITTQTPILEAILTQAAGNLDISESENLYVASNNQYLHYKTI